MEFLGNIKKMRSELEIPVVYHLPIGNSEIRMNDLIGSDINLEFRGEINCVKCGRLTNKSFAQGYCYPCFISAPETEECVLRPELCLAHEGVARDMEYAKSHCLTEQVVYLSLTSDIKVGVTRGTQVPTRWIDQGAVKAIELARTPNRHMAGVIEVFLKDHMKDRTNWRAMLKNDYHFEGDMMKLKQDTIFLLPDELAKYKSPINEVIEISYPVLNYPNKVSSLNFDKESHVSGKLIGIKGQYLIFEGDKVLNVRKFGGYKIKISY
jgi:hypothetical protein